MFFDDNKLIIIARPKCITLVLINTVDNSLRSKNGSIIRHIEFLTKQRIKHEIKQLLSKYKHETTFMNTEEQMKHSNSFLSYYKNHIWKAQIIKFLLFKTFLFITCGNYKTTAQKQ